MSRCNTVRTNSSSVSGISFSEIKRSLSYPNDQFAHRDSFTEVINTSLQDCSTIYAMKAVADVQWSPKKDETSIPVTTIVKKKKICTVRKMYLAALASLLMAVSMGMATGFSAPATYDMQRRPNGRITVDDDEITWIGSIIALGALTGGIFAGPLADKLGRKGILIYNAIPFVCGWLLIIYAPTVFVIFIGRVICGFSCGIISVTVPMYTVEISTSEVRGLLGSSFQGLLVVGSLASMIIGSYIPWSWLAVASVSVVIIGLACLCPMPESPRWLIAHKKLERAVEALEFLQGEDFDSLGECRIIFEDLQLQPPGRLSWRECLHPTIYKPALLSAAQMFFQQLSGANAILFYTPSIFESVGSSINSTTASIIIAFIQVVATLLSNVLVDKAGRRILLGISGLFMALSLGVLGAFYFVVLNNESFRSTMSWIPLASLIVFITAFSLGYGPIPWLMVAEMVPVRARSIVSGLATFFNGLFAFMVTKTFKSLQIRLHPHGLFWLYCSVCVASCFFTGFLLPETKGKRLEDIAKIFSGIKKKQNKDLKTVSETTLKEIDA